MSIPPAKVNDLAFPDISPFQGKVDQLDFLQNLMSGFSVPSITPPAAPGMPGSAGKRKKDTADNSNIASDAESLDKNQPDKASPITAKSNSRQGEEAMQVALQEVGVKEVPKGSNRGPRVDDYQGGPKGQYWCAHFVSWCVEQSGTSPFGHTASVHRLRRWGQRNGKYVAANKAMPAAGDIFTKPRYDKAGKLVGGHTGFVTGYNAKNKTVSTVEGNTADAVKEKTRSLSSLDGFIRI